MAGRKEDKARHSTPGPGNYNPRVDPAKENLGNVKIGTSKRDGLYGGKSNSPGPGNYKMGGSVNGPQYGFGSGSRGKAKASDIPGPGHYKVPYRVAEVPKYIIPDKPEEFKWR